MENKNGLGLTTDETLALAQGLEPGPRKATSAQKSITTSNFLYGYPLEAPSKKLYFIEDAMRRRIPRILNETGGVAAHWKRITAINAGKVKAGVAAGEVATSMTLTSDEKSVNYKSFNQYTDYTDEARIFGRKFEDVPQLGMLAVLQSLMIQEDRYDIGGNITALGAPTGLAAVDSDTAGSLSASTAYDFGVSALTLHGYLNGAKGIVAAADSPDETDPDTLTTFSTASGKTSVTLTWTDVPGAFAYNVYSAAHGATLKWQKTVFANTCNLGTVAAGNAPNAADQTADAYGYDGILAQCVAAGSGAYYKSMDGAPLTTNGSGGVSQFDTLLQSIWNSYRVSPTMALINAQESDSITKLSVGSSATNAVRININQEDKNKFTAGAAVTSYFNRYTQQLIELVTSVHMPPGKIIFVGENVPYPNAETPNNLEKELQQEYYGEMFARVKRVTPVGATMIGALKLYLPGACGILANCGAA